MSIDSIARGLAALALASSGGGVSLSGNNTWTGANAFNAGLTLGGNISAASWGLTGVKLIGGGSTLTDTSAAGTVASGATDVFGGNTIAATNLRTVTDYCSVWIKNPIAGTNVTITNKWSLGLEGGLIIGGNARLFGDSSNTLNIRNTTNAQKIALANTWTDAANKEEGVFDWIATANTLTIGTTKAGTGSSRALQFVMGGTSIFNINTSGHLLWNTDNTYDFGDATHRPRTGYFGTQLRVGSPTAAAGSAGFGIAASGSAVNYQIVSENTVSNSSTSGGVVSVIQNGAAALVSGDRIGLFVFSGSSNASTLRSGAGLAAFATQTWSEGSAYGTRFELQTVSNGSTSRTTKLIIGQGGIITFGATEANTVPALKPSSAVLQARLGDDSAYAVFDAIHRLQGTAPSTASDTGTAGDIRYDSGFIYIATGVNTWKRVAIATF